MLLNGNVKTLLGCMFVLTVAVSGCATTKNITEVVPDAHIDDFSVNYDVKPGLKYRVAISRFEDKTGYGENLFGVIDDLGEQAADVLASHLVKSGRVILVERQDMDKLETEASLQGKNMQDTIVWANALILGAVTEFGTKTEYDRAAFEKRKMQTAHAKVTVRMVDPESSVAFYSEFGEANTKKVATMKFGYGGAADYDATLTDKALNGAIVKLVNNILNTLVDRTWEGRIVHVEGGQVFINAGEHTGLNVGDMLAVIQPGKKVKNPASNAMIQLPGEKVGTLKIVSFFGESEVEEGSVCEVVTGPVPTTGHIIQVEEA